MVDSFDSSTLYAGFLLAVVGYWLIFFSVKAFVRRTWPKIFEELSQDKAGRLTPFIVMIVRIICGLTMSFPWCIQAAATTEWGYGRTPNKAGQVCVASQGLVWVTELQAMAEYSDHLLVHHLMCMVISANVIIAPKVHQIKPLYTFFASQCADLGPGSIVILKALGLRPSNSRLLRYATMATTAGLVGSKAAITLHSFALAFHSPYRIGDWMWGFCLLFFGIYCLDSAYKNLKWINIISIASKQPVGFVVGETMRVSMSSLIVTFGAIGALLFNVYVYSATLNHKLHPWELLTAWLANVAMLAIGSVVVHKTSWLWRPSSDVLQTTKGGTRETNLLYQLAAVFIGVCSLLAELLDLNVTTAPFDLQRALATMTLSIPLWEAITQAGNCLLLKLERMHNPPEEVMEKATVEQTRARARQNRREVVFHWRMAWLNALILLSAMCLPSSSLTFVEKGKIGLCAHALLQVVGEVLLKPKHAMRKNNKSKKMAVSTGMTITPPVVESVVAFSNLSLTLPFQLAAHYVGIIAVVLAAASSCGFILGQLRRPKPARSRSPSSKASGLKPDSDSDPDCGPAPKRTYSAIQVSVVTISILQVIMAKELLSRPNYSLQGETSVGFQNLRTAIRSGPTVPGIIIMGLSMWAVLDMMKGKR